MDILEDVSKLTTIPLETLHKLADKIVWSICSAIQEKDIKDNESIDLDIGIGILHILNTDDDIIYKFQPSQDLDKGVLQTIIKGKNPLVLNLEETLVSRILNTQKDVI